MRSLALGFVVAASVGCTYPVIVQSLQAPEIPLPSARVPASLGLFVDAARVPDQAAVHDSHASPMCGFIRYPLTAREAFTTSVVETIRASARKVQLLDSAPHSWNFGDPGLDAALLVEVEEFVVNLFPRRNVVGAEFEGEAELTLLLVAFTQNGREVRKTLGAAATQKAVDRWGVGGCAGGVPPAARAAERAIRRAMTQLAEWISVAPELGGSPVRPLRERG